MSQDGQRKSRFAQIIIVFILLAGICVAAGITGLWVLTAIPIGFLFGFFLQKGDLCGASAFSEVLVMRDWRKTWGLWVCIVTGMSVFAILDLLGWVTLNPKPFLWVNYLVGGILFGAGMVLSGGCISGSLYKAGVGHINSIVTLVGIPIGIGMVEYGPLSAWNAQRTTRVWKSADGGAMTLSSLSGLPFWAVAVLLVLLTLVIARFLPKQRSDFAGQKRSRFSLVGALTAKSWRPWQAGLLIGLLGGAAYVSSAASGRNYPLGVTHGVMHAQLLVTDSNLQFIYQPPKPAATPAPAPAPAPSANPGKKVSLWLIFVVVGVVAGGWFSAWLAGQARLIPKPPEQVFVALLGSIITGAGAALATGCVIGNILSGVALASMGMVFFTIVVVLANWATTYFYFMGGTIGVKE